jgi:hypothetical protein
MLLRISTWKIERVPAIRTGRGKMLRVKILGLTFATERAHQDWQFAVGANKQK